MVVEYDGRNYYGFQWQANLPTIQAELERAIQELTGESSRVIAASRTDTGVHARGQVVSFRTKSALSPQTFVRALNYYLPRDIAVKGACKVNMDFNVRRDAVSREYDYCILNSSTRSPLFEGFAYFVPKKLNIKVMNKTCEFLEGEHDFASFAAALGKLRSTTRTVYGAKVTKEDEMVTYHMTANSFLPHQVRNTVGLLIRIGLGKVGLEEVQQIMEAKRLGLAGPTAPGYGLCLTKVNYPGNLELAI
ncbi:MAG: tRNA pseudouridine(38-40) synthase TruA [Chloroflexi bacterium]|nr:tRNA pseudouridine(38-40) synthase TruA [Chloroflexota bacterium]MBL7061727.1 tRNA pseudouridine(38-40) synthase TruA [Dehalococcoidia bacterium]